MLSLVFWANGKLYNIRQTFFYHTDKKAYRKDGALIKI